MVARAVSSSSTSSTELTSRSTKARISESDTPSASRVIGLSR
jgi:hypothetical protein